VAVLGGREGMSRSLGSVHGGSVTRFLGGALRGVVSRVIDVRDVASINNGIAVSRDGCTLLVSDGRSGGSHAIYEISIADGSRRRVIGGEGDGPLQFKEPRQVCIAPDDFVFVADAGNHRVQVLTPTLDFHCFIGEGERGRPVCICANADVVVVSQNRCCVAVFKRCDGTLLRRFGSDGRGDGQFMGACGVCFMSGDRHVAVADFLNGRVSVFSVEGEFIRHVGVGVLNCPESVAVSAFDELVVADLGNRCLRVFSSSGDVLASVGDCFSGVAVHGSSVFAVDQCLGIVLVFTSELGGAGAVSCSASAALMLLLLLRTSTAALFHVWLQRRCPHRRDRDVQWKTVSCIVHCTRGAAWSQCGMRNVDE
jgi:hypothetical protein